MKEKNNKNNTKRNIAIGAGVATLAATGYLLFGPDGKKNRKITQDWMMKMKGEVVEKMDSIKDATKNTYYDVVDKIAETYTTLTDKKDVDKFVKELKSQWKLFLDENTKKQKKVTQKTA